ncbi:MAG: DNA cytosine methyltransferase [Clostridia bacterium]|nr:DNA cytosine methyltransferase [Clostridia bacterium]
MSFTIGSLFDGSGGFPLSAFMCGGVPVWASEIEPYPIAVTTSRFPYMKHIGSVTDVNGANVEPVDVITFGSPCQDLSVAGKRAGLKHEDNGDDETTRSGLFMEAVRIIKEMREKTNGEYPKFAVWENVPGAFSSNKGEDFRIVLEELIKIVEPSAVMPDVPKFGWAYADSYSGNGWSIAYRVLDAQYWGVAQRRRRIYLVLDLRGQCARKVLFEREGLRGYFTEGRTPWQTTPADVERSVGANDSAVGCDLYNHTLTGDKAVTLNANSGTSANHAGPTVAIPYTLKIRSGVSVDSYGKAAGKGALIQKNLSATLGVSQDQYLFQPVCYGIGAYDSNAMKSDNPHSGIYEADTSRTLDVNGGNPACNQGGIAIVQGIDGYNADVTGDKAATLGVNCGMSTGRNGVITVEPGIAAREGGHIYEGVSGGNVPMVMETVGVDCYNLCTTGGVGRTVTTASGGLNEHIPVVMCMATQQGGAEIAENLCPTITAAAGMSGNNQPVAVYEETVALEGNGQRPSHRGDGYSVTDKSYTLNSTEVHGVVYAVDQGGGKSQANVSENLSPTLTCTHGGEPAVCLGIGIQSSQGVDKIGEDLSPCLINGSNPGWQNGVAYAECLETFHCTTEENKAQPLKARDYKDPLTVVYSDTSPKYIVRRLTPTECARLQGFPDRWGDIDKKTEFTDEEYQFWLNVRNTHAEINGKQVKEYDKKQMLTWYNKLHNDSAEYKLWGNGIALPCALYVMQGIAEIVEQH